MSLLLDGVGMFPHTWMLVSVLVAVLAEVLQALKLTSRCDVIIYTYSNMAAESSANILASLIHLANFAILEKGVDLNAFREL